MLDQAARSTEDDWPRFRDAYAARLDALFAEKPIPFRRQNGGHYDRGCVLRPGLGAGRTGTSIHILEDGDPPQSPAIRTATAPLTRERG
jgi:NAD(P)H dehydrogenase (quinone)